jgi:putative tryptophan/tyrosine transport system substrate-binding protein
MRRREFIALLSSAAAWPLAGRAQQSDRMRRIGVLMNGAATEGARQSWVAAFNQALRGSGWVEGQNIRVDVRWNAGDAQLARIYAAQLIGLMPDVILASSTINLRVIQEAPPIAASSAKGKRSPGTGRTPKWSAAGRSGLSGAGLLRERRF